jgi:DNA-binding CsgD family transcriptional regulator/MFS family permease
MLHPLCYGLFFVTCLRFPPPDHSRVVRLPLGPSVNRTGYGVFLFALALALGNFARYCILYLLEGSGLAAGMATGMAAGTATDPLRAVAFLFNTITVSIAGIGISSLVCVIALGNAASNAAQEETLKGDDTPGASLRTDWSGILGLIGISAVHKVLSGIMEWRLNPELLIVVEKANQPIIFVVLAVIILCGLFAGRSLRMFVRSFLPPALILFIFIPCLVLFDGEKHSGFLQFMNILFSIFSHVVWVVFTAALIELYAGKFWLYGLAIVMYFTNVFQFIGPQAARMIPTGTEYVVLTAGIAAAAFLLLSYRIIVPKKPPEALAAGKTEIANGKAAGIADSFDDIFRERGLTDREIEIAGLLAKEGLPAREIADRLYVSTNTINKHTANIFRKFGVNKRAELMAMLWRGEADKEE